MRDLTLLGNSWMAAGKNKMKYDYVSKKVRESAKDLINKIIIEFKKEDNRNKINEKI